jgi:methylmalonyl-CoA mutase C-terminal domain/subunit
VEAAIQEDLAAIGLSLLSGAHNEFFKQVIDLFQVRGAEDIMVFY